MHSDLCCRLAPPRPCYRSAFEVPGVLTPHDLAVVPAPLDATGAGGTLVQPALLTDARLPLLLCCRPWRHITLLPICILYAAESLLPHPAGERLLAVLVSETRDNGSNSLHKFVFAPAGGVPASQPACLPACLPACMSPFNLSPPNLMQRLSHRNYLYLLLLPPPIS